MLAMLKNNEKKLSWLDVLLYALLAPIVSLLLYCARSVSGYGRYGIIVLDIWYDQIFWMVVYPVVTVVFALGIALSKRIRVQSVWIFWMMVVLIQLLIFILSG